MVVYYEISERPTLPRVIGASKEACFLCNSFIKGHGLFCVSKAHCHVYSQWAVPDLAAYGEESLIRMRRTLVSVNRDVTSTLEQARCNRSFRPFPLQSSTNLQKPNLPTPSVTSVPSSSREGSCITSMVVESPRQEPVVIPPADEILKMNQLRLEDGSSGAISANEARPLLSRETSTRNPTEIERDSNDTSRSSRCWGMELGSTDSESPQRISFAWLDTYVFLEGSACGGPFTSSAFGRASVTLEAASNNMTVGAGKGQHLELDELAAGEEVVLLCPNRKQADTHLANELIVILRYQGLSPIAMRCSWFNAAEVLG